jgi:hypothetical protein
MDKLSESKRAEVKKMSDARLMSKLMQAGYSADQVEAMNREVLMSTWAEIVVTGKEVASATAVPRQMGYDIEVEKQRLAWEISRYEEQKALEAERREEQKALEAEQRAERNRREDEELAMRRKEIALKEAKIKKLDVDNELRRKCEDAQLKLKNDELKLRQEELARQRERDIIEKDRAESLVTKIKKLEMQ